MRYWRSFTLLDGILVSPVRVAYRWPGPGPDMAATCIASHTPPAAGCSCGMYLWTAWTKNVCIRSRGPRVFAEATPTSPVLPPPADCPVYPQKTSIRVGSFRLLRLWVPHPDHCLCCWADPDSRDLGDDELQALADRYGVEVGRM